MPALDGLFYTVDVWEIEPRGFVAQAVISQTPDLRNWCLGDAKHYDPELAEHLAVYAAYQSICHKRKMKLHDRSYEHESGQEIL